MTRTLFLVLISIILAIPVMIPFLQPGYFSTHDGEWAVVRLAEMHREVKDLQLPPRWAGYLNHGYGYPLFLFTYPFPYYLGELFHLAGLGLTATVKLLFIFSIVFSAAGMFLLFNTWGWRSGLLAAVLYAYAPYRMVNLFIRGSIGESMALAFFPWLFFLLKKICESPSRKWMIILSIVWAMFILTHNAMVLLFTPFMIVWWIYHLKINKFKSLRASFFGLLTGTILTVYFWLPAIVEKSFIALSQTPLADKSQHFTTVKDLFSPVWEFGTRVPLQLGNIHIALLILSLVLYFAYFRKIQDNTVLLLFLLLSISLFMMFKVSNPFWQIPLLSEIDFPWRMLAVSSFLLSSLGAYILETKKSTGLLVLLFILVLMLSINKIKTFDRFVRPDDYYATNDATTTSADELMPVWAKIKPTNRPSEIVFLNNPEIESSLRISNDQLADSSTRLIFLATLAKDATLIINRLYFPGWRVLIDNREVQIDKTADTGLITFPVSEGTHDIKLFFKRTPIRIFADLISLMGLIIITTLCGSYLKKTLGY